MINKNDSEIATPFVVSEDFGDEYVVLNLQTGKYYSFKDSASILWRDLNNGLQPHALLKHLKESQHPHFEKVSDLFEQLLNEGLIRELDTQTESPVESQFLIAIKAGCLPPEIETFDDMADLILADPIHDVEEDIGWPAVRKPN